MGCDIHLYAEMIEVVETGDISVGRPISVRDGDGFKRISEGSGGTSTRRWVSVCPLEEDGSDEEVYLQMDSPYHGRNYMLFAWLADVRNTTYGDVPVLSEPRGLPIDVSEEIRKLSNQIGIDGHSHSWYLVSEILEAMKKEIFVPMETYVDKGEEGDDKYQKLLNDVDTKYIELDFGRQHEIKCEDTLRMALRMQLLEWREEGLSTAEVHERASVYEKDFTQKMRETTNTFRVPIDRKGIIDSYCGWSAKGFVHRWAQPLNDSIVQFKQAMDRLIEETKMQPNDLRIVFWFDN
jgi:hypothetical protein